MQQRIIKANVTVLFGAPSHPMPKEQSNAIAKFVATIHGIREAHLPQCHIEGEGNPSQILAISVDSNSDIPQIIQQLAEGLKRILPTDVYLDIWPIEAENFPEEIRQVDCKIFSAKPWWKIW